MSVMRRRRHGLLRRAAGWIALAYLIALALIAFWPTPVDRNVHGSISSVVLWLHEHGGPLWLGYDTIEFTANIALFVPVGLLVVVLTDPFHWWFAPLIGTVTSVVIELGQFAFLPDRFATVTDVVANSLGGVLGTLLAFIVLRLTFGHARADAP
ncbi:VanZ family protein [Cryobacterium sp. Y11]|uniref:VanZ family protein n=1 Tax=Cryobacterium sp. Y11 TaxID=2045016 RepID=UPI000CE39615|nr:VanZ family protein [Cryobacterium sp. Y11]